MKANELMIGDWVFVPHNGRMTHYGRVCGIYDSGAVSNTLEKISGLTKASALNPIPLTREILEKNGWKEAVLRHWNIEEDFALEKGEDGNMFWFLRGVSLVCSLNFVHELQHALKLCRIEKEIKV